MEDTVKNENTHLIAKGAAGAAGVALRDSGSDGDVAEVGAGADRLWRREPRKKAHARAGRE